MSQSIMNNAITEIKSTLQGNNSRITEAAEKIKYGGKQNGGNR